MNNFTGLTLQLSPTLAENLIASLEYLVGYPYGCVEQTMSKFLPNVVVYANRDKLNLKNQEIFKELPEQVEAGLKRLYDFQHADGGWGWWEDDETQPKNTAYVVYGLYMAKQAGFAVDEDVLERGIQRIEVYLDEVNVKGDEFANQDTSTWIYLSYVYTMTRNRHHPALDRVNNVYKVIDRAYESLIYAPDGDMAKSQIKYMKEKVKETGDLAYFDEEVQDYEFMNSRYLSTAVALEALVAVSPDDPLIPKLIRYINQNTIDGVYHETHATAHAVIAVVNYLSAMGVSGGLPNYEVSLNGNLIESGQLDAIKEISIDKNLLKGSDDVLSISKSGSGKVYYTFLRREFVNKDSLSAQNNGLSLIRTYYDENGSVIGGKVQAGDIVKVELKLKSGLDENLAYLMLEDFLPAGFEPINPELQGGIDEYEGDRLYKGEMFGTWWTANREYWDDRVLMFVNSFSGEESKFYYYARAVTPGTYKINPARAEMMYMPEINGGSGSAQITIE